MTDAEKTTAEIRADYDKAHQFTRDRYTFEEYRSRFYFERNLVEGFAENIIAHGGTAADVVEYVLSRVNDVYGTYNDGCSCCAYNTLSQSLGLEKEEEDDLDEEF